MFPEILMACAHLKLAAQPEQKYYPRAGVMELGRVRVQLKNDLNQPLNDDIQDRAYDAILASLRLALST